MRYHRIGLFSLILLCIISGFYFYSEYKYHRSYKVVIPESSWDGQVPAEIVYGDKRKKQVIFTFDAGSSNTSIEKILETLKKHHVKGTFFMTGTWVLNNREIVRRIVSDGHEIFNHSFNHPHLTELSDIEVISQLEDMDATLMNIAGTSTKPYFRPPYGDRNAHVLRLAAQAGYTSVYWTIDAGDWEEGSGRSADEVRQKIISNLRPGMIILMHVGDTITGMILDDIFTTIEDQGYRLVSLTQGI